MDMIGGAEILRRRIEQRRISMADASNAERVEVFQGDNGEWYWHAKAGNNEVVANSAPESYTRSEDAVRAAEGTFPGIPCSVSTTINPPTETGEEDAAEYDPETELAQDDDPEATT